jgi:ferredoxin
MDPMKKTHPFQIIFLILYVAMLYLIAAYIRYPSPDMFRLTLYILLFLTAYLTYKIHRSLGLATDLCVAVPFIWWISPGIGSHTALVTLFPLIAGIWLIGSYRLPSRIALPLAWIGSLVWLIAGYESLLSLKPAYLIVPVGSGILMLMIFSQMKMSAKRVPVKHIDCLISSYSANTAHYANAFIRGACQQGTDVTVHRFHRFKSFNLALQGDALMVAFPVYGCKPPWPLLNFLIFKLPAGRGKPAFIAYTCIGGAENAGMLCWLILTIKGYRVTGRTMTIYPLNTPTFRLGPKRIWSWLDSRLPDRRDVELQRCSGRDFAAGRCSGVPFIFGLTPGFLVGILLDNKLLDRVLYRNHVMKKRCTGCGLCIDICPAQRLTMQRGYPKAGGDCMICMSCVNICPVNAMHLWGWTEYGNRYPPKYREFLY